MTTTLPAGVLRQIRALGTALTPAAIAGSWAILTAYHEELGYTAPRVERDLSYGIHATNRLDVHAPAAQSPAPGPGGLPVLLFVHGGGFAAGDRHVVTSADPGRRRLTTGVSSRGRPVRWGHYQAPSEHGCVLRAYGPGGCGG
ncbi:MAG TPA: hypothetical protein VH478_22700 [Trebonia sp.]|nr:hypothetical protein [Trebonia sp.]